MGKDYNLWLDMPKNVQTIVDQTIRYNIKSVYGKDNMYVVSDHAGAIQLLTGRKTIDKADMIALEGLGFNFEQVL